MRSARARCYGDAALAAACPSRPARTATRAPRPVRASVRSSPVGARAHLELGDSPAPARRSETRVTGASVARASWTRRERRLLDEAEPDEDARAARGGSRRPHGSTSSASPPRFSIRSIASRAPVARSRLMPRGRPLEGHGPRRGTPSGISAGRALVEVDEDERLRRGDHQEVVVQPVGGALVGRRSCGRSARRGRRSRAGRRTAPARGTRRVEARITNSRPRIAAAADARGAGGTRRARGRSTAGTGRSRRRPGRRCPRTRRARAPST